MREELIVLLSLQTVDADRRVDRAQVPGSVAEGHVRAQSGAARDSSKGGLMNNLQLMPHFRFTCPRMDFT